MSLTTRFVLGLTDKPNFLVYFTVVTPQFMVLCFQVTELYRKLQQSRLRRKQVPKKDIEAVRRAIAEREKLRKELENCA